MTFSDLNIEIVVLVAVYLTPFTACRYIAFLDFKEAVSPRMNIFYTYSNGFTKLFFTIFYYFCHETNLISFLFKKAAQRWKPFMVILIRTFILNKIGRIIHLRDRVIKTKQGRFGIIIPDHYVYQLCLNS